MKCKERTERRKDIAKTIVAIFATIVSVVFAIYCFIDIIKAITILIVAAFATIVIFFIFGVTMMLWDFIEDVL